MKSKEILDALNDIDFDMVEDARGAKKKRARACWLKWGTLAACLCLAVLAAVLPFVAGREEPPVDPIYWVDDRERRDGKVLDRESGVEIEWQYLPIFQQYGYIFFNVTEYYSRSGTGIPLECVGEKLGDDVAYDGSDSSERSIECEVYRIEGVDPSAMVAVKYAGQDDFYPFYSDRAAWGHRDLGDVISTLNLTEYVTFDRFYCDEDDTKAYGLSAEDGAVLWEMFLKYTDAEVPSVPDFDGFSLFDMIGWEDRIGFLVTSEALGIENLSWSVTAEGYLWTNIVGSGCFYIGEDAAKEITDFVLANKTDAAVNEKQYLTGVVTEIGEGYIKVDDSIMMKDPDDGMVFTVYTDHYRISPYVKCGYIRVGETVQITHGRLSKDSPTEVRNATDIGVAIVTENGETLIPE